MSDLTLWMGWVGAAMLVIGVRELCESLWTDPYYDEHVRSSEDKLE